MLMAKWTDVISECATGLGSAVRGKFGIVGRVSRANDWRRRFLQPKEVEDVLERLIDVIVLRRMESIPRRTDSHLFQLVPSNGLVRITLMRYSPFTLVILYLVLVGGSLPWVSSEAQEATTIVVEPRDNGQALVNPDMGWTMHFYSNIISNYGSQLAPSDTLNDFPGLSTVYLRLPWSFLEPAEGQFDWSVVDTPAQRWIAQGKRVAFRISCCESWMRYATPEWVEQAGAKGHNFTVGKGVDEHGPFWEPVYDDPVFLEKLEKFLAVFAKRYDGNPHVAFIDVGSFGVWGEGHCWASTKLEIDDATKLQHIDLHAEVLSAHAIGGQRRLHWPWTTRWHIIRSPITCSSEGSRCATTASVCSHLRIPGSMPNWLRASGPNSRSCWNTNTTGHRSIARLGVTDRCCCSRWKSTTHRTCRFTGGRTSFWTANRDVIDRINRRLGYRLQLRSLTWPRQIKLGEPFRVAATWANAGVAPCYPGGYMALTLKDAQGGIVSVHVLDQLDMRDLGVGPPNGSPRFGRTGHMHGGSRLRGRTASFQRAASRGRTTCSCQSARWMARLRSPCRWTRRTGSAGIGSGPSEVVHRALGVASSRLWPARIAESRRTAGRLVHQPASDGFWKRRCLLRCPVCPASFTALGRAIMGTTPPHEIRNV